MASLTSSGLFFRLVRVDLLQQRVRFSVACRPIMMDASLLVGLAFAWLVY